MDSRNIRQEFNIGKEIEDFDRNLKYTVPVLSILDDLSFSKYDFFDPSEPEVTKIVSGKYFEMRVPLHLNLRLEGLFDSYVQVDFGTNNNFLQINNQGNDKKTLHIETREQIYCDNNIGYVAVIRAFAENFFKTTHQKIFFDDETAKIGYYMDWADTTSKFAINLNDDLLLFDDPDKRHNSFRGWTGGYYPFEAFPAKILSKNLEEQKRSFESSQKMKDLEKRLNTIKILFDDIKKVSGMQPVDKYKNFPHQGKVILADMLAEYSYRFADSLKSENYSFMRKFGSDLRKMFDLENDFENAIHVEDEYPSIVFADKRSSAKFGIERIGPEDNRFYCIVHVPLKYAKDKEENSTYNKDNNIYISRPDDIAPNPTAVAFEYVKEDKQLPLALERCLKKIVG